MTSTAGSTVRFSFCVWNQGYREYRATWVPVANEILRAQLELHNPHDSYAIAVMKKLPGMLAESVVEHQISGLTYFIILHGGRVSCKIKSVQYRRSPLIPARVSFRRGRGGAFAPPPPPPPLGI